MSTTGYLQNQAAEDEAKLADELRQPVWSVVSFERREAGGLAYSEALKKLAELEAQKIPGLCVVTDEAASRIGTGKN